MMNIDTQAAYAYLPRSQLCLPVAKQEQPFQRRACAIRRYIRCRKVEYSVNGQSGDQYPDYVTA
jgi:hypothetical protein